MWVKYRGKIYREIYGGNIGENAGEKYMGK